MKQFELSLWRSIPKTYNSTPYIGEEKLYILASSDGLDNPYRAYEIHFIKKINSEKILTFKVLKKCFDPSTGNIENNYFVDLLVNKALIKLKYKDKWYDFLIQDREEISDQKGVAFQFSCEDLAICELSKTGTNLVFDEENGMGTIHDLAPKILEGTDYQYDQAGSDILKEYKTGWEYDAEDKTYHQTQTEVPVATIKWSKYLKQWTYQLNPQTPGDTSLSSTNWYMIPETEIKEPEVVRNLIYNSSEFVDTTGWEGETGDTIRIDAEFAGNNECQGDKYYLWCAANGIFYNNTMIDNKTSLDKEKIYCFRFKGTNNSSNRLSKLQIYEGYNFLKGVNQGKTPIFDSSTASIGSTSHYTYLMSDTYYLIKLNVDVKNPQFRFVCAATETKFELFEFFELVAKPRSVAMPYYNKDYYIRTMNNREIAYITTPNFLIAECAYLVNDIITGYYSDVQKYFSFPVENNQIVDDEEVSVIWKTFMDYHTDITAVSEIGVYGSKPTSIGSSYKYGIYNGQYYKNDSNNHAVLADDILYTTNGDKRRTLIASKSNRFQLLQNLSELFSAWVKVNILHNNDGSIQVIDGIPQKKISFVEIVGKENPIGFKYGINLKGITRKIQSKEIVSKTIVEDNENANVENGIISIRESQQNTMGENFIYNFNYYVNAGLIDGDTLNTRLLELISYLGTRNKNEKELRLKQIELTHNISEMQSDISTYTALRKSLQEVIDDKLAQIKRSAEQVAAQGAGTGLSPKTIRDYRVIVAQYGQKISAVNEKIAASIEENNILPATTAYTKFYPGDSGHTNDGGFTTSVILKPHTVYSFWGLYDKIEIAATNLSIETDLNIDQFTTNDSFDGQTQITLTIKLFNAIEVDELPVITSLTSYNNIYKQNGQFYYIDQENEVWATIDNIGTFVDNIIDTFVICESPYIPGQFQERKQGSYYTGIAAAQSQYDTYENTIQTSFTERKDAITAFEKEYSRFLSEGTWTDNNYIDNDTFYYDALQVAYTSAMPKAEYTINVLDISKIQDDIGEFDPVSDFEFDIGDKTYVVDEELFGKDQNDAFIKQEVIVSQTEVVLDNPSKSTIQVKNYRTQFEDLFQRIAAATTTLTLKEQIYNKADLFTPDGQVDKTILQKTLSENNFLFTNADAVKFQMDDSGITLQSIVNPNKMLRIISEGILISNDGGVTWTTGISSDGLNANHLNAGSIDTSRIRIYSNNAMSFSWDELGITAYSIEKGEEAHRVLTDKFVRLDRYGLYLVDGNNSFNTDINGIPWDNTLSEDSAVDAIMSNAKVSITKRGFAYNVTNNGASIHIGDGDNDYAILVKDSNNHIKFSVEWDGTTYIDTSLTIGQWSIDTQGLYYGNDALTSNIFLRPQPLTSSSYPSLLFNVADKFTVDSSGNIFANSGEIGGWTLKNNGFSTTVYSGSTYSWNFEIKIPSSTTATSDYVISCTRQSSTTVTYFYVRSDGYLFSRLGVIAGWTISNTSLSKKFTASNTTYTVGTYAPQTTTSKVFTIQNGATSYPFYVQADGFLHAENAEITGTINATNSTFSGKITANEGNIADWYLLTGIPASGRPYGMIGNASNANDATVGMVCGNYYWYGSNDSDHRIRFWAGDNISTGNPNFIVLQNGQVIAKNLILGGLNASSQTARINEDEAYFFSKKIWLFPGTVKDSNIVIGDEQFCGISITRGTTNWEQVMYGTWQPPTWASSRKYKNSIESFADLYDYFFDNLKPRTFNYNNAKTPRRHFGLILDEVQEAFEKAGLTSDDIGAYCLEDINDPNGYGGLKYTEFVALNTWQIQKLKSRVKELENEITNLKSLLKS